MLGVGRWGAGHGARGAWCWALGTEHGARGAWHGARGTGHGVWGAGCWVLGAGHGARGAGHGARGKGHGARCTGHGARGTGHVTRDAGRGACSTGQGSQDAGRTWFEGLQCLVVPPQLLLQGGERDSGCAVAGGEGNYLLVGAHRLVELTETVEALAVSQPHRRLKRNARKQNFFKSVL